MGYYVDADITGVHVVQSYCVEVLKLEDYDGGSRSFWEETVVAALKGNKWEINSCWDFGEL